MGIKRFSAVNTKVRALAKNNLSSAQFHELLEKQSVSEIISYLKTTGYGPALKEIQPEGTTIGQLEILFRRVMFQRFQKLIHFFQDEYKKFFRILFMRYEIEDLKLFVRTLYRKAPLCSVMDHIVILGVGQNLNYEKISKARDWDELVQSLSGSPYADLVAYYEKEQENRRPFYIEMNLDRFYFKTLLTQIDRLEKKDSVLIQEALGKNIDLLNLQWIYRGRKIYNLASEELLNYTLTGGKNFSYGLLKNFCYESNLENFMEKIQKTPYHFLVNEGRFEMLMEIEIERYIYETFKKLKKTNPMTIMESISYMHHLEYEIRDLFTIFEAQNYGIDKNTIKSYLVVKI